MGIIRAAVGSIGGTLADQWKEVIEPEEMNNEVLASYGVTVRKGDKRGANKKGTKDIISNGSVIHVPENTYMLLVDGGKIVAATEEAGYYIVQDSESPSIFFQEDPLTIDDSDENSIRRPGGIESTIKDTFQRFKFGGVTPYKQKVIYINKQEIPNIRFGTRTPVPYNDRVLVPGRMVPTKITSFGTYSIKIADPILFYMEVCSKSGKETLKSIDMAEQYLNEFLTAYQTSLASLSLEQISVIDIPIKTVELGKYMADVLDEEWLGKRGFFIYSVGIGGINYDEKTNDLLDKYANDSILFDPNARAARMTGSLSEGMAAAGANAGGAMMGFANMGMAMNGVNSMAGIMNPSNTTYDPTQQNQASGQNLGWRCSCGHTNTEKSSFCSNCGTKNPNKIEDTWKCVDCGNENEGKFCNNCGAKKPSKEWTCEECGTENEGKFCGNCGTKRP